MNKKSFYRDKYFLISTVGCFLIALVSFAPFIIADGGNLTICGDFQEQAIPYYIAANKAVRTGKLGWQWNAGLGTSFVSMYSFYYLGSPFFWLSILFPANAFPYLIGWILCLKFALAGSTSYLFIKRFVTNPQNAVVGAMLYSFSGFQAANLIFYPFFEVTAFFPLMLIGLEKLNLDKKKGLFAAAVAINGIVNYFFFTGEILFCVFYYFCRRYDENSEGINWGVRIKSIWMNLKEGVIGSLIASILIIPNFVALNSNPRLSNGLYGSTALVSNCIKYLNILKGIFLPAEDMAAPSIEGGTAQWESVYAWIPAAGIVLVVAYVKNHKKAWERSLLLCSLVISMCPILCSSFYLFSSTYMRWWYMPILIMSLCCAKTLDEKEYVQIKTSAKIVIIILFIFAAYMLIIPWSPEKVSGIADEGKFLTGLGISIASATIVCFCGMGKTEKYAFRIIVGLAVFTSVLQMMLCTGYYRKSNNLSAYEWKNEYETASLLKSYDSNYRYAGWDNLNCYVGGVSQCGNFSSIVSKGVFELYDAFGMNRNSEDSLNIPGVTAWLGGRFFTSQTMYEGSEDYVYDRVSNGKMDKYIFKTNACPIAHYYDTYVLRSEFDTQGDEEKGILLTYALVIPDDKAGEVEGLKHLDVSGVSIDPDIALYEGIMDSEEKKLEISDISGDGFILRGDFKDNTYAFVAVPVDDGWTAYVDGRVTHILDVCGMMAVPVSGDTMEVKFVYTTPGLWQGALLSLLGLILLLPVLRKNKKN